MATATKTVETEILDLEKRYWQALKDQDADTAMRLTDEPAIELGYMLDCAECIVTGAQGVGAIDRKTLGTMVKSASYTLHRFDLKPGAQVRLLGDDVAIVAYQVREELTVDGKPVELDAAEEDALLQAFDATGRELAAAEVVRALPKTTKAPKKVDTREKRNRKRLAEVGAVYDLTQLREPPRT